MMYTQAMRHAALVLGCALPVYGLKVQSQTAVMTGQNPANDWDESCADSQDSVNTFTPYKERWAQLKRELQGEHNIHDLREQFQEHKKESEVAAFDSVAQSEVMKTIMQDFDLKAILDSDQSAKEMINRANKDGDFQGAVELVANPLDCDFKKVEKFTGILEKLRNDLKKFTTDLISEIDTTSKLYLYREFVNTHSIENGENHTEKISFKDSNRVASLIFGFVAANPDRSSIIYDIVITPIRFLGLWIAAVHSRDGLDVLRSLAFGAGPAGKRERADSESESGSGILDEVAPRVAVPADTEVIGKEETPDPASASDKLDEVRAPEKVESESGLKMVGRMAKKGLNALFKSVRKDVKQGVSKGIEESRTDFRNCVEHGTKSILRDVANELCAVTGLDHVFENGAGDVLQGAHEFDQGVEHDHDDAAIEQTQDESTPRVKVVQHQDQLTSVDVVRHQDEKPVHKTEKDQTRRGGYTSDGYERRVGYLADGTSYERRVGHLADGTSYDVVD